MEKITLKKYAVRHKKSIFEVMKLVKSNQLKSETVEENGKEVLYIIEEDTNEEPTPQPTPTSQSLEERVKVLEERVRFLEKQLRKQIVL
jgi:polyhydroxyalkanoate synthesis regulator phasin